MIDVKTCPACGGTGRIKIHRPLFSRACSLCGGTGKLSDQGTTNRTDPTKERAHTTKHGPASGDCQSVQGA